MEPKAAVNLGSQGKLKTDSASAAGELAGVSMRLSEPITDTKSHNPNLTQMSAFTSAGYQLIEVFQRLSSIKKPGFFRKNTESTEEANFDVIHELLKVATPADLLKFFSKCSTDIELFLGLTFNPANKNRKLTEKAIELSTSLILHSTEIYLDYNKRSHCFAPSISILNPQLVELLMAPGTAAQLGSLYGHCLSLLSISFANCTPRSFTYKLKVEKLKSFKNYEARLADTEGKDNSKTKDQLKRDDLLLSDMANHILVTVTEAAEARLLSICQTVLELLGDAISIADGGRMDIRAETYSLEISLVIKDKRRIFDLLASMFDSMLAKPDHQLALMSLMQNQVAKYIQRLLENINKVINFDLLVLTFELISKLFQKRKQIFNQSEEEDAEYDLSGSSDEKIAASISSLGKENTDEIQSFRHLQAMTGRMYKLLVDRLLGLTSSEDHDDNWQMFQQQGSSRLKFPGQISVGSTIVSPASVLIKKIHPISLPYQYQDISTQPNIEFDIFKLFTNSCQMVNYLEVFENQYSLKLVKSLMGKFKTAIEMTKLSSKAAERVLKVLKIVECTEKPASCSCFVSQLMGIFFKLALKTSQIMIKELFKQLYELLNCSLECPLLIKRVPSCLFKVFAKNFASILSQNLESIQKMSIQLIAPDEAGSPNPSARKISSSTTNKNHKGHHSNLAIQPSIMAIVDYRRTASIGGVRFNIFPEYIRINGKHVRITKEVCETILMIVARTPGIEKFLAGDIIKIELGLEENQIISSHELNQLLQERWQVKLLFFRAALVKMCSKLLFQIYTKEENNKVFESFHGFFSDLNEKRYQSVHSFNLGFITDLFTKRFMLTDYKTPCFFKFLTIFDIQIRGIGYYDRDDRIPLPGPVKKDFLEMLVTPLKVKIDTNDTRLLMLQLLIAKRLDDMMIRDPPLLKCLVPLIFDIALEIIHNFEHVDIHNRDIQDGVKVISSEPSAIPNPNTSQNSQTNAAETPLESTTNNLLAAVLKILVGVLNICSLYPKFPIILKPQVFTNGKFISAGGFPFATFNDIKLHLLKPEFLSSLIVKVDKYSTSSLAQTYLAKLLTFASYRNPQTVLPLFGQILSKCGEISCSDEVYKIRMKLIIAILAVDNNCVMNAGSLLRGIVDCFEKLIFDSRFSSVKKQWFLTVLMKWVYLSTQSDLPIDRIRVLIDTLKQVNEPDLYLLENYMILESYLASIRGLFSAGGKKLRVPSIFDEWSILSRMRMQQLVNMIEKYYKDESIEEEARLLQYHFDLNLFEYFSQDKKSLPFQKLLEVLLQKIKHNDLKWMYIYDVKNVILYSIAESAPDELCIFKRHIGGKICWFLEESRDKLYVKKNKLEVLRPQVSRLTYYKDSPDQSMISNLLNLYRAKQDLLFPNTVRYPDLNLLDLSEAQSEPVRSSFVDIYPDYLKNYWDYSSSSDSGNNPSLDKAKSQKHQRVIASFSTDGANIAASNTTPNSNPQLLKQANVVIPTARKESDYGTQSEESENQKDYSEDDSSVSSRRPSITNSERIFRTDPNGKEMSLSTLSTNTGLTDPRIRFILQFGLFSQAASTSTRETVRLSRDFKIFDVDSAPEQKCRFKSSLTIIDKNKIVNVFKVGILFAGTNQDKEEDILANTYPSTGLFPKFINGLGERGNGGNVQKYLGSDMIQYTVGPLINRKSADCTVEVKRIVGNTPTLILWSQNPFSINFDEFKSKFTNEKIIIEELPNGLLKVRTLRKMDDKDLDEVFKIDALMDLDCLLNMIHSYIFATQMEINPKLFNSLTKDYKMISPFLEARKKKIRELTEVYAVATKPLNIDTLCELIFQPARK